MLSVAAQQSLYNFVNISGSHGFENESYGYLGSFGVKSDRSLPTFQRCSLDIYLNKPDSNYGRT
jgi:hypothetical protein